jgi:hypothetical protein
MSELQRSDGTAPDAGSGNRPSRHTDEKDPVTWYGLVRRIVREAMGDNATLIRVCVLICLVCGAIWLIASVIR